jgi:hypothetical protein
MPPRGYHDEYKKQLKRQFDNPERAALAKPASGREHDLPHLVKISMLHDRDGISSHAAAEKISDGIGGDARLRHANKKRLYRKFQKAPALYRRLAAAPEDPKTAAHREILLELGLNPNRFLEPPLNAEEKARLVEE